MRMRKKHKVWSILNTEYLALGILDDGSRASIRRVVLVNIDCLLLVLTKDEGI